MRRMQWFVLGQWIPLADFGDGQWAFLAWKANVIAVKSSQSLSISFGYQISLRALPADFRSTPEHFLRLPQCEFHSRPFFFSNTAWTVQSVNSTVFLFYSTTWTVQRVNSTVFLFHQYNLNYPECESHSLPFSAAQPELSWVWIPQSPFFSLCSRPTPWTVQRVNSIVFLFLDAAEQSANSMSLETALRMSASYYLHVVSDKPPTQDTSCTGKSPYHFPRVWTLKPGGCMCVRACVSARACV